MPAENDAILPPAYQTFTDAIAVLDLPFSASELHGIMCGYLCAGAGIEGEAYLRTLTPNKKAESDRKAALAMFGVYSVSQHQLTSFDFSFQLLLPDEHALLADRAQAFGEWCEGFLQGMTIAGMGYDELQEEESQEALQNLHEFAQLDYESLDVEEEDEKALMEVSEYVRMAVLRLYSDLLSGGNHDASATH